MGSPSDDYLTEKTLDPAKRILADAPTGLPPETLTAEAAPTPEVASTPEGVDASAPSTGATAAQEA